MRSLRCPFQRVRHMIFKGSLCHLTIGNNWHSTLHHSHLLSILVREQSLYLQTFHRGTIILYESIYLQFSITIILIQISYYLPIHQASLGRCHHPHIIKDTSQSPVVLPFQVIAITIFCHHYCNGILTFLQIRSNVIFSRFLGTFIIAHLLSVHPYKRSRSDFLKAQEYLFPTPICRQVERGAIGTGWVILARHMRRICLKRCMNVSEQLIAIALHFPIGRYVYQIPLAVIIVCLKKLLWNVFWHISEIKLPLSIERKIVFGDIVCMSFFLSLLKHLRILNATIDVI